MSNELTEKQVKFLDLLYKDGLPQNLIKKAHEVKEEAGYSSTYSTYSILRTLKQEIVDRNLEYMVLHSAESINALHDIVRTPTTPGNDTKLKAINSYLDRAGFGKKETTEIEIKAEKGIVILPAKTI